MRLLSYLARTSVILIIGITFCSSPTAPETIFGIGGEGGRPLWFVKRDHITPADRYRVGDFCYVTLTDKRNFSPEEREAYPVLFTSSIGDSEYVQTYEITLPTDVIPEEAWYFSGASILTRPYGPAKGNGALEVGPNGGVISASYYHAWERTTIRREVQIIP